MNIHGGPEPHDSPAPGRPLSEGAVFTPLLFSDGLGWVRITSPQPGPRAACLSIAAHIHLMRPAVPLRELDARAETAIRALEEGAVTVTVIDDRHRVDRTSLAPPAGPAGRVLSGPPAGSA